MTPNRINLNDDLVGKHQKSAAKPIGKPNLIIKAKNIIKSDSMYCKDFTVGSPAIQS